MFWNVPLCLWRLLITARNDLCWLVFSLSLVTLGGTRPPSPEVLKSSATSNERLSILQETQATRKQATSENNVINQNVEMIITITGQYEAVKRWRIVTMEEVTSMEEVTMVNKPAQVLKGLVNISAPVVTTYLRLMGEGHKVPTKRNVVSEPTLVAWFLWKCVVKHWWLVLAVCFPVRECVVKFWPTLVFKL